MEMSAENRVSEKQRCLGERSRAVEPGKNNKVKGLLHHTTMLCLIEKHFPYDSLGSSMKKLQYRKLRPGGTCRQMQTRTNNAHKGPRKGKADNFSPFSCPLFSMLVVQELHQKKNVRPIT